MCVCVMYVYIQAHSEREGERERERYSEREREIGSDSTLIAERERERERDWTLMPDVFMCIYMLVIGEGREGERHTHETYREGEKHAITRAHTKCFPVMSRRHVWYRS